LELLGQIGELVGGIGALAALVYLAVQIRHSNSVARAQSRQTLLDTFSQLNWELACDPALARVIARGVRSWPDLSNEDMTAFDLAMGRYLSNLQNGLLLVEEGMLDQETFDGIASYMLVSVPTSGGMRWWKETVFASPAVREYIEARLADPATLPPKFDEAVPHWHALGEDAPD
jgi:hypothetical protein